MRELNKQDLEGMVGKEIHDFKIEPNLDSDGSVIGYNIYVTPVKTLEHINVDVTISPSKTNLFTRMGRFWKKVIKNTKKIF